MKAAVRRCSFAKKIPMSAVPAEASLTQRRNAAPSRPVAVDRPAVILLLGCLAAFAMSWPHLVEVWRTGVFSDTDDAMRLVQIRDWLGGQGWFDLVQHRLAPPDGLLMHWSRIVDVPVGGLIRLFALVTSTDRAETLARIVFPLALQVALLALAIATARLLVGPDALLPAMILTVMSGFTFEQFPAGRIDHHAPQIVLLVGMLLALASSLSPGRAWRALLAGLCLAVSLGISLENLPFMAVLVAVLPLVWVVWPAQARDPLLWFALGLALFVPAIFVATIPAARYGAVVCDAFSIAHLVGVGVGAAGLAGLASLTGRLPSVAARGVALLLVGGAVAACLLLAYPACLHDPYAGMDPRLQALWLAHVTEAQPLMVASRQRPDTFLILLCPLLAGGAGAALAAWAEAGVARVRWLAVLALTLVGIAGTFWEIRVAASAQPIALLGGAWAVTRSLASARRRASPLWSVLAALLILPFSTIAWAFVPVAPPSAEFSTTHAAGLACREPAALAPLAAMPPGLVFAPIDDGSHLLAHTPHAVVAAPYHRNQAGNKTVLDGFMASAFDAQAIVRTSGARYVALCPDEVQISVMAEEAPEGLGSALTQGRIPAWLRPVPLAGTPYRVFELR